MTELKTLGFGGIVDCLSYRFRVAQVIVNSESSAKMAARPDSSASMGLMPELSAFTDTTSVSPVVVNGATDVCKATLRLTRLVLKLAETPLMSVRAVRASIRVSAMIREGSGCRQHLHAQTLPIPLVTSLAVFIISYFVLFIDNFFV